MIRRSAGIWVGIAALLTIVYWLAGLNQPFSAELHAFASAHMAELAHSFSQLGVIHLHGVPLQNNLPLGLEPDRYLHWPPLYPTLLSLFFNIFGETAVVIHGFVILVNLFYLAAFYILVKRCADEDVALCALFVLLTLPSFTLFSRLVWTPNAALCAICISLYCYLRGTESTLNWKWISTGAIALAIGVFLSWEPALLGFALLILAFFNRTRARVTAASLYALVGAVSVAAVILLLISSSPELRDELWSTFRYRMGGAYNPTQIPIHAWGDQYVYSQQISATAWFLNLSVNWVSYLGGALGLIAVFGILLWSWLNRKTRPELYTTIGGLLVLVLLWMLIFPNHIYFHDYQTLFVVPAVSIALGFCIKLASEKLSGKLHWVLTLVLPALLLFLQIRIIYLELAPQPPDPVIGYAMDIRAQTPAASIVLSPSSSMIPVYYSQRHIIRGVSNEAILAKVIAQTATVFPGSDVYLAMMPMDMQYFPCIANRYWAVQQTQNMILYKLSASAGQECLEAR